MSKIESLRWKKYPVLDKGFVCLVDVMGNDQSVVQAARVSYGKDDRQTTINKIRGEEMESSGNGDIPDEMCLQEQARKDCDLIRYLMRHRHTTPFEMVEFKFLVKVPMDCWRQWIRHRTASVNEYSTRYSEAIDSNHQTASTEWRLQSKDNKQGSSGFLGGEEGMVLSALEKDFQEMSKIVYKGRLESGVAKEQARKDLLLSTYTEAYWKIDLHNLFHFLSLRMDEHAQQEIREYAQAIAEIIKQVVPISWQAFVDYRLNGMFLTSQDIQVLKRLLEEEEFEEATSELGKREKNECLKKMQGLGILN